MSDTATNHIGAVAGVQLLPRLIATVALHRLPALAWLATRVHKIGGILFDHALSIGAAAAGGICLALRLPWWLVLIITPTMEAALFHLLAGRLRMGVGKLSSKLRALLRAVRQAPYQLGQLIMRLIIG